ncbi:glycosyltransferase family 4 protein [Acetobacterium wieringae]|uniref:Glycosyltransferase family 4 protein n=1 Tax=Acetobacterium wieringae TaxID=52694 RepID=A0A5D0WHN6_9FIRM|nr:glycosyltransferase family 4 protein [Acetobacterium wieringae]TYC82205.1 glycosyltransferase family 4 protein [Acetobacterium wieringae]
MKKKVLILVNHDVVIYNFRKELVERLLADGYQVIISSPYGERIDDLLEMGCKYIETEIERHGTNPFNEFKLLNFYKNLMRDIKPDVVLTYTIKPNIYGGYAAKKYDIPYIANITGLGTAVEKKSVMQQITIALYKLAFSKIQRVFFQNTENMKFFKDNNIVVDRHRLIPGSGVNLEHFQLLDYPPEDTTEFVFISRIMKEKGIDQYIETAKYITSKYQNTKFHVCGFCEERYEDVLSDLQNSGVLIYHGMIRDVREILKKTHCTIHPSYYPEGLSNVLLESAACGRPIITTDRSGCRDVVDHCYNGYMVKQKDSVDLIKSVEKFIKLVYEKKKQMGLAGREKVGEEFNRQTVVAAYMDEIESIH